MKTRVLTRFQEKVLTLFFDKGLGERGFYLTGGTALSEFYLQHRYSDDLYFFSREQGPLARDFRWLRETLVSFGLTILFQQVNDEFARYFIQTVGGEEEQLKVEFSRDVPAMMDQPLTKDKIVVDSFLDIAVNKVCTVSSRWPLEPKDFCDLYFILNESNYELEYLIHRAREKEAILEGEDGVLAFATNLIEVRNFTFLPGCPPFPFHTHLQGRMDQRGISREEIEKTLIDGREADDPKPGTFGKVCVFPYKEYWEGEYFEEKEVSTSKAAKVISPMGCCVSIMIICYLLIAPVKNLLTRLDGTGEMPARREGLPSSYNVTIALRIRCVTADIPYYFLCLHQETFSASFPLMYL